MLPDSFLTELKYRCDIEQMIAPYVVLKRTGRNLKGLCPFHSEKSPSFVVYPETQSFYCFGCGAGGDVVTFIRKAENLEYLESVRFLAEKVGMALPEEVEKDTTAQLRTRIYEMNRESARYFNKALLAPVGAQGLEYLLARGITRKTITRFGLGYAPDTWDSLRDHLKSKGYTYEEMTAAALVTERTTQRGKSWYDSFRGRVIFPILDLRGNVIAFGGRTLGERGPKYLNSSDTPVFKKSRNLFALNFAKAVKADQMILAEGYMDVIAIHQAGFQNAVATLGTALTSEQARLISQYCKEVIIAYDSDGPGQAATKRAINLFDQSGIKVRVLAIPDAKDPDEYIKKFGVTRFKLLLEGSANALEYEIAKISTKYDTETADGKVGFLKEFAQLMAGIYNPVEREVYIAQQSNRLGVAKEAVLAQVRSIQKQRKRTEERKQGQNIPIYSQEVAVNRQDPQRSKYIRYALAEDKLLVLLMKNPDYYGYVSSRLAPSEWVTDLNRSIYQALCQRLSANQPVDMISMASVLGEAELSRLSWLMASSEGFTFGRQEADDYIETIRGFHLQKSGEDLAQMDNAQLEEYIKQITAKKK